MIQFSFLNFCLIFPGEKKTFFFGGDHMESFLEQLKKTSNIFYHYMLCQKKLEPAFYIPLITLRTQFVAHQPSCKFFLFFFEYGVVIEAVRAADG